MIRSNLSIILLFAALGLLATMTKGDNLRSQRFLQEEATDTDAASSNSGNYTEEIGDSGSNVVGGTDVNNGEFPFYVHFGDGSCGGTLISENRILTAAHCVQPGVFGGGHPATVRIGAEDSTRDGQIRRVSCAKSHPDWNPSDPFKNDIAVLKLFLCTDKQTVNLNTNTSIPNPLASVPATLIGYGQTTAGEGTGSGSDNLQKLTYRTVTDARCKNAWGSGITTGLSVCARNTRRTGACFGDSGGPLLDGDTGKTQWGIVSGGASNCAANGIPDVYTDVAAFQGWINEQLTSTECDSCFDTAFLSLTERGKSVVSTVSNYAGGTVSTYFGGF